MKYFFTADYHLGHANIIKYCNRPFQDVNEMNNTIIYNHNQRVKPEDIVFFGGDFCFRNSAGGKKGEGETYKAEHYLKQLNGRFVFIKGNHDRNNSLKTIIERLVISYGGKRVNIVHNPIHADNSYIINLVGHVHNNWIFRKLNNKSDMINIGIDVWNFRPITFEEIMKKYNQWKKTLPQVKNG